MHLFTCIPVTIVLLLVFQKSNRYSNNAYGYCGLFTIGHTLRQCNYT
jgi:hypothetical protein